MLARLPCPAKHRPTPASSLCSERRPRAICLIAGTFWPVFPHQPPQRVEGSFGTEKEQSPGLSGKAAFGEQQSSCRDDRRVSIVSWGGGSPRPGVQARREAGVCTASPDGLRAAGFFGRRKHSRP